MFPLRRGQAIRVALVLIVCLGSPISGASQTHPDQANPPASEYPSLRLTGFGNIDFAAQNKSEGPRGFNEGHFVLHLAWRCRRG
jgi:hypothetical protein